jgi:3-oxoacyl-[acyl-carrier-protein] synthase II
MEDKPYYFWELLKLFNEWRDVQNVLEKALGCGLQFIDINGEGVLEKKYTSTVCQLMLNSKKGYKRCINSYIKKCFCEQALRDEFYIFTCHAGLINFSIPVILHQKPQAAIVSGCLFMDKVNKEKYVEYAHQMDIEPERLLEAIEKIKQVSRDELISIGKMFKLLVNPLRYDISKYYSIVERNLSLVEIIKEKEKHLKIDELTGLHSRQYIWTRLEEEIHRAMEYNRALSFMVIYVNNLKQINELYGYEAGNNVLKEVANILLDAKRRSDVLGRFGGNEFAIILPETNKDKAIKVADKLQDKLREHRVCIKDDKNISLDIIYGVGELSDTTGTVDSLVKETEQKVYNIRTIIESRKKSKDIRCVITGIGVISPIGIGIDAFKDGLLKGVSGVSKISQFDTSSLGVEIAAEVKDFDPLMYMDKKRVKRTDRTTQFAIAAARMAIEDAEIDLSSKNKEEIGVVIGAGMGGLGFGEEQYLKFIKYGPRKVSPLLSLIIFAGACSSGVSMEFGIKGPSITISTGCSAGTDAIGYALESIRNGEVKIMIAGGAEAPIRPLILTSFEVMGALSSRNDMPEKASRPFDAKRDGFVLGEGAGVVVLEELKHACERGAHIYAELIGYATTDDAYHMVAPAPDGRQAARAIELSLQDAKLQPEDVEYINAHGSSTPLNDRIETLIIKNVFGKHAYKLAISSTKSMVGHPIGAAGAIELIATLIGMNNGFLPPTINYEYSDPECDLDYIPNEPRKADIDVAISNSFGFGGKNSIIVVKRYKDDTDKK